MYCLVPLAAQKFYGVGSRQRSTGIRAPARLGFYALRSMLPAPDMLFVPVNERCEYRIYAEDAVVR